MDHTWSKEKYSQKQDTATQVIGTKRDIPCTVLFLQSKNKNTLYPVILNMANSISCEPPFLLLLLPFLSQRATEEEEERGFLFLLRFQKAEMNGNSLPRFLFEKGREGFFPLFASSSLLLLFFLARRVRGRVPLCYGVSREQLSTIILIHPSEETIFFSILSNSNPTSILSRFPSLFHAIWERESLNFPLPPPWKEGEK